MIYAVNMVDCMLVLAVGFLIFTVMSMNIESVVFSDMSPQEKKEVTNLLKQTVDIKMASKLNETPQIENGSCSGYESVGKVYRDPKTGKLIMIQGS